MDDQQLSNIMAIVAQCHEIVSEAAEKWRECLDDAEVGSSIATVAELLTTRLLVHSVLGRDDAPEKLREVAIAMGARLEPQASEMFVDFLRDMAAEGEPVGLQ